MQLLAYINNFFYTFLGLLIRIIMCGWNKNGIIVNFIIVIRRGPIQVPETILARKLSYNISNFSLHPSYQCTLHPGPIGNIFLGGMMNKEKMNRREK